MNKIRCDKVDCWYCEHILTGREYNYCTAFHKECTERIVNKEVKIKKKNTCKYRFLNQQLIGIHPASTQRRKKKSKI